MILQKNIIQFIALINIKTQMQKFINAYSLAME